MTRSILITGASRGIGRAIALYLAKTGYNDEKYDIVIHYNSSKDKALELLEEVKNEGATGRILKFDISEEKKCKKAIEADMAKNGVYYGVICNAGISADDPFPAMSSTNWNKVINTNLGGFYNVLHPIVMPMVQSRQAGRIITLSSISGIVGNRGQVNYSASKAGIIGATKALALELAKRKITVNCIAPGLIESEMTQDLPLEEITKAIPLRRIGKAEEVASLAAYLLSDGAAYITKQVISVNGGLA